MVRTLSAPLVPTRVVTDPLQSLMGPVGSTDRDLFDRLVVAVQNALSDAALGVRKGYVSFSLHVQFMVVTRSPRSRGLTIGLSDQDWNLPPLAEAKGLGGSARMRFRLPLTGSDEIERVLTHALAAARGSTPLRMPAT